MKTEAIEISNFTDEGYQPLVVYGEWRVAVLRYHKDAEPEKILTMERHTLTDEVFVLTHGKAVLVIGGTDANLGDLQAYPMERGQIYNVKRNAWHTTLLSQDAHIVIVENDNTTKDNSESTPLNNSHLDQLMTIAKEIPL